MKRKLMALLAALGLVGASPAAPSPAQPPAAWVRYAELAGRTFPAWLDEPTPAAARLRDYLDGLRADGRGQDVVLPLSVWVAPDGAVSRVVFPVFAQPEPNADLQAVLVGRKLPQPPPAGLPFPMRLQLRIAPPGRDAASRPAAAAPERVS